MWRGEERVKRSNKKMRSMGGEEEGKDEKEMLVPGSLEEQATYITTH